MEKPITDEKPPGTPTITYEFEREVYEEEIINLEKRIASVIEKINEGGANLEKIKQDLSNYIDLMLETKLALARLRQVSGPKRKEEIAVN